jgi:putative ABC transport system permease protein
MSPKQRRDRTTSWRAAASARAENVASAFQAIHGQKLRSFLTCLGIIIGVSTVILMVSLIQGFNQSIVGDFQRFGSTLVQFQRFEDRFGPPELRPEDERLRPLLTLEDADAIRRRATAVRWVSPERWWYDGADVRYRGERSSGATVGGVTWEYPEANSHFIEQGRFFTEGEERHSAQVAVIGVGIAEALFPQVDPLDREISVEGRPFRVIGVFEKKGGSFDGGSADQQIVMPIGMFDRIWPEVKLERGLVIATIPWKPEWVPLAIEQGTQILRDRHGLRFTDPDDFFIRTPERTIRIFKQITGGVSAAMIVIAGISLVIGGVGVMNIMLINVTQRTREIGLRKALGARSSDIRMQFRTEAMTLALLGGGGGVVIGLGLAVLIGQFAPFPAAISPGAIAAGLGVSHAVGYFFGTYPAYRAARLNPIDALHYE